MFPFSSSGVGSLIFRRPFQQTGLSLDLGSWTWSHEAAHLHARSQSRICLWVGIACIEEAIVESVINWLYLTALPRMLARHYQMSSAHKWTAGMLSIPILQILFPASDATRINNNTYRPSRRSQLATCNSFTAIASRILSGSRRTRRSTRSLVVVWESCCVRELL